MISPEEVHAAMQSAPHDGKPHRQARAAIAAIVAIEARAEGRQAAEGLSEEIENL